MPDNLFEIRQRINAAAETRKITRTMELVASSRLQRSKQQLAAFAPTLRHLEQASACLPETYFSPLPECCGKPAFLVFAGAKGLSGAYGTTLLRFAAERVPGAFLLAVGSAAAAEYPDAQFCFGDDAPSPAFVQTLLNAAETLCQSGKASEVQLIYTKGYTPVTKRLFPLPEPASADAAEALILEPSPRALYPALYSAYARAILYEAHLQAYTAEQVARVAAMDHATRNAGDIINELQADYNRIRQASITAEIIMVSGAANATGGD